jgi:hypothetical protein
MVSIRGTFDPVCRSTGVSVFHASCGAGAALLSARFTRTLIGVHSQRIRILFRDTKMAPRQLFTPFLAFFGKDDRL